MKFPDVSPAVQITKMTNLLLRGLLRVRVLSPDEVGTVIERLGNRASVDGVSIQLDNPLVTPYFKGLLVLGSYETYERYIIHKYLPIHEPVIELGASIGVVSCIVNSRLTRPNQHVVVEANPALIPTLKKNRELNGSQFTIIEAALGYGSDSLTFFSNGLSLLGSIFHGGGQKLEVPTKTLQAIAEKAGFQHFTLISDIEGSEIGLIEHEMAFIREHVGWILIETHDDTPYGEAGVKLVEENLLANGFEIVDSTHNNYCFRNTTSLKEVG